jgi:Putative 2OG-Fe(II) oxygenase
MCTAAETPKQDLVNANIYFPTIIYQIEKPEFLEAVGKIAEEALVKIGSQKKLNEIYPVHITGNLFDKPDIIPFQYYVGGTAANLLSEQGYNLEGFEPYFSEMFCQEHFKHSAMEQHVHGAGSQMVGFYFLETPENCSKVVFHDPRAGKPMISWNEKDMAQATHASNAINFTPKPGMLMFTNAWLPHSFSRHEADEPIKFIHFNIGLRQSSMAAFNQCISPAAEIV